MVTLIRRLLEMIRFSHTLFALPFALLSATLAWTQEPFRWQDLLGILLCMVFARSAGMAFNRVVDRQWDAKNPRTANRHLPAGTLSVTTVWTFTAICSVCFVAATLIFWWREPSNPWPLYLSVPVLIFVGVYSLTKRFTVLAHFWLGASLMLAPLAAWIAVRGMVDLATPLVLGAAVFFWVAGFDILYACQDVDFDRQAKLRSVPARFGVPRSLRIALICHLAMLILLFSLAWIHPKLNEVYLVGLSLIAVLLAYEHWLVRPDDLSRVNRAFFQVNAVVSVGLFLLVLLQLVVNTWY